jgi:hypothetical protein
MSEPAGPSDEPSASPARLHACSPSHAGCSCAAIPATVAFATLGDAARTIKLVGSGRRLAGRARARAARPCIAPAEVQRPLMQ